MHGVTFSLHLDGVIGKNQLTLETFRRNLKKKKWPRRSCALTLNNCVFFQSVILFSNIVPCHKHFYTTNIYLVSTVDTDDL